MTYRPLRPESYSGATGGVRLIVTGVELARRSLGLHLPRDVLGGNDHHLVGHSLRSRRGLNLEVPLDLAFFVTTRHPAFRIIKPARHLNLGVLCQAVGELLVGHGVVYHNTRLVGALDFGVDDGGALSLCSHLLPDLNLRDGHQQTENGCD